GLLPSQTSQKEKQPSRIHHYIVEKREASRRCWQEVRKSSVQMLRVTDLLEGVPYFFRVFAENQYGQGEAFETVDPVIATAEPAPPKRLDIVDTTDSTATLAWLKPEHDGGSRIIGYIIETKAKGTNNWVVGGHTNSLSMVIEGLAENTEYEFCVKAKNDAGFSEPREALASVIIKEPRIEPTADLSGITEQLITCKSGTTFTIDVPISGRPVPKVTWKLEEMRLKETDRVSLKTTKDRTTLIVKECMRGDGGKYFLNLENIAGSKTFTVTVNVIGRPSAPTGPIQVSSITSESCVLTWEPPEDDGGTDITNYIIEKRESGSTAWQLVNSSVKRTKFQVSPLGEGEVYEFRVIAKNTAGVHSLPSLSTGSVQSIIKQQIHYFFFSLGPPTVELDSKILAGTLTVRSGSDLVLDAAVGGKPDPKVFWAKGDKELELCEKYFLQYTNTRAMAIIKFCDRNDSGIYNLTVKNASGVKTATVKVKVLGKCSSVQEAYCGLENG
uniref:Titin n=1 Tax=Paramormyrops kingsleyae TaxID=1676925 RepID=A0A3B3QHR2_9TELE